MADKRALHTRILDKGDISPAITETPTQNGNTPSGRIGMAFPDQTDEAYRVHR